MSEVFATVTLASDRIWSSPAFATPLHIEKLLRLGLWDVNFTCTAQTIDAAFSDLRHHAWFQYRRNGRAAFHRRKEFYESRLVLLRRAAVGGSIGYPLKFLLPQFGIAKHRIELIVELDADKA